MKKILRTYPLSLTVTLIVLALSFMPIPFIDLGDAPFHIGWDKWTHFAEFSVLSLAVLLEEERANHLIQVRNILYLALALMLFGGLVEICQEYLTTYRSGRMDDFVADSLGVVLGVIIHQLKLHFV